MSEKAPLETNNTFTEALHPVHNETVPSDKINLQFLLVNGRRTDLIVAPTDTIDFIQQRAFDTWPKGGYKNFDEHLTELLQNGPMKYQKLHKQ